MIFRNWVAGLNATKRCSLSTRSLRRCWLGAFKPRGAFGLRPLERRFPAHENPSAVARQWAD
jgi:hypothetical protein